MVYIISYKPGISTILLFCTDLHASLVMNLYIHVHLLICIVHV